MTAPRSKTIISGPARVLLAALSAILFIPIAAIPFQDRASLEQFHTRSLAKWPSFDFLADPIRYFAESKKWIADRIYPITQASTLQNNFLFFVLHTAPQRRITLGRNNLIFVNGDAEQHLNNLFEAACVRPDNLELVQDFKDSLSLMAAFARDRGMAIDVVLIPTLPTLYGDFLPSSVPSAYRIACSERAAGQSPLLHIEAPHPVHYVYPFAEMRALRDDEALFPKANFHPTGLSLKIARDAYLVDLGVNERVDDTLERGTARSEVLSTYGISKYFPVYTIRNPHLGEDGEAKSALRKALLPMFKPYPVDIHVYNNSRPVLAKTALMVSDSFGTVASGVFAGAFRRLFHVGINNIPEGRLIELIGKMQAIAPVDRLIFLVNDGNFPIITENGRALARAGVASYR
jgi:hypothetical protein